MSTPSAGIEALDRGLELRIRDVLTALSLLSETPASSLAASVSSSSPGSAPPPGVVLDRSGGDDADWRDLSLFEHYRRRFAVAEDAHQRRLVLFLAEEEYDRHARREIPRPRETTLERESRLLRDYADVDPQLVAALEKKSDSYIRKLRQRNGLDPYTGLAAAA